MNTRHLMPIALGALALFSVSASYIARADDAPVTLVRVDKPGDIHRYKAKLKFSLENGGEATLEQTMKQTIKDVKKTGDIIIIEENESGHLSFGGNEQDLPASAPITITKDKLGKLLDYKVEKSEEGVMSPEVGHLMASINTVFLTDKAVKPNDTWATEIDNPAVKSKKVTIKSSYLGTEKVDGVDLWKIKQTAEAVVNDDGDKITQEETDWLDPISGQIVKFEETTKNVPTRYGKMNWTAQITVIKDDKTTKTETKDAAK